MGDYERRQCEQLGEADTYGIQLDNDGAANNWRETKRMLVIADQFRRIAVILAEDGETECVTCERVIKRGEARHPVIIGHQSGVQCGDCHAGG